MAAPAVRLLLAEDNSDDAELAIFELRRAGLRPVHRVVQSAEAFVAGLHEFGPDVILSDFSMPRFDGMDALRIAREIRPETPFIFVSGTLGEEYAIRALKSGATDYVIKTNIARLPAAVERAVAEAQMLRERRRIATELEIARERLQEREAALSRAQAMARLGHVITGAGGTFESWSDTLPEMIGVNPLNMLHSAREWLKMVHAEDRASFRAKMLEAEKEGDRVDVEYRLRRPDGLSIHLRQVIEPLRGTRRPEDPKRWFSTLLDVTEERRAQNELRASESLKGAVLQSSLDCIITMNKEGVIVEFNPAAEATFGIARDKAVGRRMAELLIPPHLRDAHHRGFANYLATGEAPILGKRLELEATRADGTIFPIELTVAAINSGVVGMFSGFIRDITARREAEGKIKRLNRVYAVLSGINGLIVRAKTRGEIYREACRIAVEDGQFRMAWLGEPDQALERAIPIAWAGEGVRSFLDSAPALSGDPKTKGTGLAWRAVNEKRVVVSNDIQNDPQTVMKEQCLERNVKSLAMLPLMVQDRAIGVLALYSGEIGLFDDAEMRLLNELAGDIAFAIHHIEQSEKLDYLAYYDGLTGLANPSLLRERLTQYISAGAESQNKLAIMIVDLERFRLVNDSLGRRAGDLLLTRFAERLKTALADVNHLARLGADQFAIIFPVVKSELDAARLLRDLSKACLESPFEIAGREVRMSAKAGIALVANHGADADLVLSKAEAALQKAKESAEPYLFFEREMTERVAEALSLETALRRALEHQEFVLHYQPRVDLKTRRIKGVEALIRWKSKDGLVPPMKFIPLLEQTGLILEVGAWALSRAVQQHSDWINEGMEAPRIAVNVSAVQLKQRDFVAKMRQAVLGGATPPGVDLEITESMIMEDVERNVEKLRAVRDLGIPVAIDDFGTGYSSLAYLARLPVNSLKIDRSFIITMLADAPAMTLVTTMISLAHSLGLSVTAEGVDAEEQAKALLLLGCDEMQGYLFSKPLPADVLLELMRKG